MPTADNSNTERIRRRKAIALAIGPRPVGPQPVDKETLQNIDFGKAAPYIGVWANGPAPPSVCCPQIMN